MKGSLVQLHAAQCCTCTHTFYVSSHVHHGHGGVLSQLTELLVVSITDHSLQVLHAPGRQIHVGQAFCVLHKQLTFIYNCDET